MNVPIKLSVLFCAALLAGCSGSDFQDLQDYVTEAKNQPRAGIKKLPSIPDYEAVPFEGMGLSDPFFPRRPIMTGSDAGAKVDAPPSPDAKRPREHLEQFALDQLKVTGFVVDVKKKPVALIQAPDKRVHMVGVGQYLGTNFGQVVKVTESGVVLKERYYESGTWQSRDVTLQANPK